jgi:hypothetical protein
MANNYLQFSATLDLVNEDEKKWWKRHIIDVNQACEVAKVEDLDSATNLPIEVERFKKIVWLEDNNDEYDFNNSFSKDDDGNWSIWFTAEESGNVNQLTELVHYFFKDMRPDGEDVFVLRWACTCAKMRVDEFDGGTAVSTKNGVGWCGRDKQEDVAKKDILEP